MIREFRLSPRGRGVSCDTNGVFVGPVPLLRRSGGRGRGTWKPRDCARLSKQISADFGLPIDLSSKMGGLKAIANALNEGDLPRAQIAAVLLGKPDPPLSKGDSSSRKTIQFIRDLHWSGLLKWNEDRSGMSFSSETRTNNSEARGIETGLKKAGYNPDEPRDERGRWTTGGDSATDEGNESGRIAGAQLADAGISDASNDPAAQAAARAAAIAAAPNHASGASAVKPVDGDHEGFWETLASRLSDGAQSALSQIGQAEISENDTERAASMAVANSIVSDLKAYANYRAQPWIDSNGVPIQVPTINPDDPMAYMTGLMGHDLLEPDAPLTRPGTNADWIDSVIDLGSAATIIAGPALEVADVGTAAVADTAELADAPFIIPPLELPPKFDITWPVGRYMIPKDVGPGTIYGNLVHKQIGELFQDSFPDIDITLRTAPSDTDVDIEIPTDDVSDTGFRYAEIKPLSNGGYRRYKGQIARWKKPEQVLAITYDYKGNIYYGFPW